MSEDMVLMFREMDEERRKRRAERLASEDPTGWSKYTKYHWYMDINGERLHYWPSNPVYKYRGKYYYKQPHNLIKKLKGGA